MGARDACRGRPSSRADAPTVHQIIVDDDGDGIAPDLREAVLQRGVRADEAAPGSGLGLAIVRDLAELYGGSIVSMRRPRAACAHSSASRDDPPGARAPPVAVL